MARPSIQEAVARKRQGEAPAALRQVPITVKEDVPVSREPLQAAPSREGKINVSAYFPPEVKASLRLVQAKRGGKVQDLLAEALNLLFAKYNVPETAPVGKKEA